MGLLVRERPPLPLEYKITVPGGGIFRWADDEPNPGNVPNGESFSDVIPGGFDTLDLTLPRKQGMDFGDGKLYSTIQALGAGGEVAYEGRIAGVPDVSGDQMAITPQAEGWKEHFGDDTSAAEIFVDIDMTGWQGESLARQIYLTTAGVTPGDGSTIQDSAISESPAMETSFDSPWDATHLPDSEAWYDSQGIPLGSLYYAGKKGPNVSSADDFWDGQLSTDDNLSASDSTGNLRTGANPFAATLTATTATRVFAAVRFFHNTSAQAADNIHYSIYWTCLGVYGQHGLTGYGTTGATQTSGFIASDVIAYAVQRWAPKVTIADSEGFVPTSFVIPHLVFKDMSTVSDMLSGANRFELRQWAVWEGPKLYYHDIAAGPRAKKWRAQVGPSKLQQTGPSTSRIANGVIVRYQDVTGVTRTVGPVGSGAYVEDASLSDDDLTNPATVAGINKWAVIDMNGTSTYLGAIQIGAIFLTQLQRLDTSGQATLVGHVMDDHGMYWPYWKVRSGDQISFTDATDTSYRNIIGTSKDVGGRSVSIDLDAPSEGLDALLERLQVVLVRFGL